MMSLSATRICARYPFDMASARITSRCINMQAALIRVDVRYFWLI